MKIRRKTIVVIAVVVLALVVAIDFFHVSGRELSWASEASDEASVTVEVMDESGVKTLAVHELTRGEGIALQSLLLRTGYLRSFADSVQAENNENIYRILIRFPARDVSLQLVGNRYLSGTDGLLKILDPDWEAAFNGILAAG